MDGKKFLKMLDKNQDLKNLTAAQFAQLLNK